MLTSRDKKVIDFIDTFKIATTDTIAELFYPNITIAQRRLREISYSKLIKRDRSHFTMQYQYYINKPRQVKHSLLLTDFYRELNRIATINFFDTEFIIGDLRADGLVVYEHKGVNYIAFVEVQISNQPLDIKKYEDLYRSGLYKDRFNGVFPIIIAITDKNVPKTDLKVIKVRENLENIPIGGI